MNINEHLQQLELQLLKPEVRRNQELLLSLLTEDFREFGITGRASGRLDTIKAIASDPEFNCTITEFHVKSLGAGVALVTYRAVRTDDATPSGRESLRSSTWIFRGGHWQMLFHQATSVPADRTSG